MTNCIQKNLASAKKASKTLLAMTEKEKNNVLSLMSEKLLVKAKDILDANRIDLQNAEKKNLSKAFIDRLLLNEDRLKGMSRGLKTVVALPEPLHKILSHKVLDNGLIVDKVSVPFGVIGIIYESRPNVTSDAVALCFKSGNAVVLRGGSDSLESNQAIVDVLHSCLIECGCDKDLIVFLADRERKMVIPLLNAINEVDLIIPRGGESLTHMVAEHSKVPVLKHYKGLCHIYVDSLADQTKAIDIVLNAKCQRPGVCNALETLLVHETIAPSFLSALAPVLKEKEVEIRGCSQTMSLIGKKFEVILCDETDWNTEYLDLILSIKVVQDVDEAIDHINTYGSGHSDAIVTENQERANRFLECIDSATVYHNASTRFTDGGAFGMGVEMGISTDKLHARGPIGLEELVTYKYVIRGNGQIRV